MSRLHLAVMLLVILIAAGCAPDGSVFVSPEQAGIFAATQLMPEPGNVKLDSIVVRQTQRFENKTFVLVSYERQIEGRQESCTMVYEVRRTGLGTWRPGSGGGGCSGHLVAGAEAEAEPKIGMEIGGGRGSDGNPLSPGHSYVYGLVHQEDIAAARVIWEDERVQEAPVINGSYLILRSGQIGFERVEGLNEEKQTVFGSDMWVDPAKEP